MIYVNVKSFEEMKAVANWSGDEITPLKSQYNEYKEETVVFVSQEDKYWSFSPRNYYQRKGNKVISFEQFEQKYLNGTATQDIVNHPNHYNSYSREVIDTMRGSMTPEEFKGYLKGNIMKYINRYQFKNGVEDLKKAQWYLNKLTEVVDD